MVLAFSSGVLIAYVFFTINIRKGHPSLGLATSFGQESPWGAAGLQRDVGCSHHTRALGGTPQAPKALSGSTTAVVPDRLIVAARHDDVSP